MLTIGDIFLACNHCATSAPCASCAARTNGEIGFAWYTGDPAAPLCDACIHGIGAELLAGRDEANENSFVKEFRETGTIAIREQPKLPPAVIRAALPPAALSSASAEKLGLPLAVIRALLAPFYCPSCGRSARPIFSGEKYWLVCKV
jgi:hypothetical protein